MRTHTAVVKMVMRGTRHETSGVARQVVEHYAQLDNHVGMRPAKLLAATTDSANKAILATAQNMRAVLHKGKTAVCQVESVDGKQ
jgi:Tat protein secretion system quality control protein TatD with DNase activity